MKHETLLAANAINNKIELYSAVIDGLIEIENQPEDGKKVATISMLGISNAGGYSTKSPVLPIHVVVMIREELTRIVEGLNLEFSRIKD